MDYINKKIDIVFLYIIALIVYGGFLKPIIKQNSINYYENRNSIYFEPTTLDKIPNNEFQDNIEKLENNIILHGYQNKEYINLMLEQSSIYLMCSYEESFGLVLLEAMSFGIPCIAFDSAKGATEIINSNNGYLIKNRNIEEMAKRTIRLYNDKELIKEKSINARKTSEKYSYYEVKKQWLDIVEKIYNKSLV